MSLQPLWLVRDLVIEAWYSRGKRLLLSTTEVMAKCTWIQGPKLTFLGRHQLATEIFFQSPDGKMWSPKRVFSSQRNTNRWKILVANFSFRNQNKENAFGAATAIFSITKRLAMENHDERIMPATCAVSCNYRKCFKSTLYLLLRPT